jgi:hypothetical protein
LTTLPSVFAFGFAAAFLRSTEAMTALNGLKKHFGNQSPPTLIRNRFSFHYSDENNLVEQSFQDIPADDAWYFYLSDIAGNCFYYASELVVAGGVIKLTNSTPNNTEPYLEKSSRAFGELFDLIFGVSRQIMILFGECITEIVDENLSDVEISELFEIVGAPRLKSIQVPFFFDDFEFQLKVNANARS